MDVRPVVTIIMPAYNAERYIRECINSIVNQDFVDWELVIVDDGSTDSTLAICREYAALCNKINVISQSNHGVSTARNVGLSAANGQYVMFVDADDILPAQALTVFHRAVLCCPSVDIVRGEYEAIDSTGKILFSSNKKVFNKRRHYHECDVNRFYRRYIGTDCFLWMIWLRTECIKNKSFVDGRVYMEDAEFLFSVMRELKSCVYVPGIVYRYRKYESAASSVLNERKIKDVLALSSHLVKMAKSDCAGIDADTVSYGINHCWNIVFGYLAGLPSPDRNSLCDRLELKRRVAECVGCVLSPSADMRDYLNGDNSFYEVYLKRRKRKSMLLIPHKIVSFLKSLF